MRHILSVEIDGNPVIITFHQPKTFEPSRASTGIFFSNFGWVPRDGQGSFGSVLADDFAAAGFPAFRIDMPGMGDSPGSVPDLAEDFGNGVRRGEQVPAFSAAICDLMTRYAIKRVIVAGICAPFINAVFSWGEKRIPLHGIIALDPDFICETRSDEKANLSFPQKIFSGWRWTRILSGYSAKSRYVPSIIRRILNPMVRLHDYPDNTNVPLVRIWREFVSNGTPVLMICAKFEIQHLYIKQVIKIALRGIDKSRVHVIEIPGTDHTFMLGNPMPIILKEVYRWRDRYFP